MSDTFRRRVERVIATEIRNTIRAHGPLTAADAASAAKRVFGQLHALGLLNEPGDET